MFEQIKKGAFDFPPQHWSGISEDVKDLIRRMLTVDPKQRITAKEILEHSWLTRDSKRKREEEGETPEEKRRKTEETA